MNHPEAKQQDVTPIIDGLTERIKNYSLDLSNQNLIHAAASWQEIDLKTTVTPEFRRTVIDEYIEFHNIANGNIGEKHAHNTFTDGVYSRHNLPAVSAVHSWALQNGDGKAEQSAAIAIYTLHSALKHFRDFATDNELSPRLAFADMRASAFRGNPNYTVFLGLMNIARIAAAQCLKNNLDIMPRDIPIIVGKSNPDTFWHRATHALAEFFESEEGFDMGPDFAERLRDPNTRAIVVSVDINSTLNVAESYSNLQYLEAVMVQASVKHRPSAYVFMGCIRYASAHTWHTYISCCRIRRRRSSYRRIPNTAGRSS
jgi:hypothetical protein